jgi:hypothetical protein
LTLATLPPPRKRKARRRRLDAYDTPEELARVLVAQIPIGLGTSVLEPNVGEGVWVDAARSRGAIVDAIDIDPRARGLRKARDYRVGDFLRMDLPGRWEWAIGNPPYNEAEQHVRKALDVADNVAMLLRASVIEADCRDGFWRRFPARHVWFLAQRPAFLGDGGTENAMYGFFWWDTSWGGPSTWSRLSWR